LILQGGDPSVEQRSQILLLNAIVVAGGQLQLLSLVQRAVHVLQFLQSRDVDVQPLDQSQQIPQFALLLLLLQRIAAHQTHQVLFGHIDGIVAAQDEAQLLHLHFPEVRGGRKLLEVSADVAVGPLGQVHDAVDVGHARDGQAVLHLDFGAQEDGAALDHLAHLDVGGCRQDLLDVIVVQFQRRGVYEVEDRAHCPGRDPVQVYLVLA